jgi:cytosine/creatinine deaminase
VNSTKPMDFAVDKGKILEYGENLKYRSIQELNVEQRLLIPGFVDPHVHLDIALMNSMETPGRQKRILSPSEMNDEIERRRSSFTLEDIKKRASTALEMASRHGVTIVRAQCHVDVGVGLKHLQALKEVKDEYAGRVDVQIVAFPNQGLLRHPGTLELFHEAFKSGADVMGGGSNLDIEVKGHIDTALDLAMKYDVDFDIHSDLGISDHVELEDLETVYLARRTIEKGYQGRVTAGHVCTLGSAGPDVAKRAIELIQEADISVVSQPDLYRLGRQDRSNVRRGLTRVIELLEAGVNVTYASNNIRDGYRPMGNFDPLEEALILSYGAHMDTVDDFNTLMTMSTYNGAKAANLDRYGLEPGCNADMVVLDARSPSEAIVGQVEKRYVFKSGRLMTENQVLSTHYHGSHFT